MSHRVHCNTHSIVLVFHSLCFCCMSVFCYMSHMNEAWHVRICRTKTAVLHSYVTCSSSFICDMQLFIHMWHAVLHSYVTCSSSFICDMQSSYDMPESSYDMTDMIVVRRLHATYWSVLGNSMFERAQASFGVCSKSNVNRQILETRLYMNTLFKFVMVLQVKDRLNARASSFRWLARDSKEGVLISILFNFKHNPHKSGGVPCVPFWNDVCCCTGHPSLLEPPEEGQNFCPAFKHQFSKSRPIWMNNCMSHMNAAWHEVELHATPQGRS